ncbi:MAG: hypothetical protein KIT09_00820 [Bryobacteraceae bacterium]|nr:hypothetical protein [Bryobacteraceae bacterium]
MSAALQAAPTLLRGPAASRLLTAAGINPRQYWLLVDLFSQLTERRDVLSQLGRDGIALKTVALLYAAFVGLFGLLMVAAQPSLTSYFTGFLFITVFILLSILLAETGNSLVNPVEALVLAHQPVNGATYSAAKLSHLLRIVFLLVPAINAAPAMLGLALNDSSWSYPLVHLLAGLAAGALTALFCCALFGWLLRFAPPGRLKAAGQIAEIAPWVGVILYRDLREFFAQWNVSGLLPEEAPARWGALAAAGFIAAAIVFLGLRSLSADFLVRASGIVRGGPVRRPRSRRLWFGKAIARRFGGQAARAGFEYAAIMMVRDWQFRRQMLPAMIALVGPAILAVRDFAASPFSDRFTIMHVLPHLLGVVGFWTCMLLPYGGDYKGIWLFLLAPGQALGRFAAGVYALLWLSFALIPNAVVLAIFPWYWGLPEAALFAAYSVAVSSLYLGLELRLIDGVPFGKQPLSSRTPFMMPVLIAGVLVIGIAIALQYILLFRAPAVLAAVSVLLGGAAWFATRSSLKAFEASIRYNLGLAIAESGDLYQEVDL